MPLKFPITKARKAFNANGRRKHDLGQEARPLLCFAEGSRYVVSSLARACEIFIGVRDIQIKMEEPSLTRGINIKIRNRIKYSLLSAKKSEHEIDT